jgi:hypothetical protein
MKKAKFEDVTVGKDFLGNDINPPLTLKSDKVSTNAKVLECTEYDIFESYEEIVKLSELPSNSDILKFKNNSKKASGRAKLTAAMLTAAGYEKPDTSTPEFAYNEMVKNLVSKFNIAEVEARKRVTAMTGFTPPAAA